MRIRIVLVLLVVLVVLASQAGRFLVVDAPQPSDAIVVLAGETSVRPARAVDLLRQGMAARVFLDVDARDTLYISRSRSWPSAIEVPSGERTHRCVPNHQFFYFCGDRRCQSLSAATRCASCPDCYLGVSHRPALRIFRQRLPQFQFSAAAAQDPNHFGISWWTNREWAKTTFRRMAQACVV